MLRESIYQLFLVSEKDVRAISIIQYLLKDMKTGFAKRENEKEINVYIDIEAITANRPISECSKVLDMLNCEKSKGIKIIYKIFTIGIDCKDFIYKDASIYNLDTIYLYHYGDTFKDYVSDIIHTTDKSFERTSEHKSVFDLYIVNDKYTDIINHLQKYKKSEIGEIFAQAVLDKVRNKPSCYLELKTSSDDDIRCLMNNDIISRLLASAAVHRSGDNINVYCIGFNNKNIRLVLNSLKGHIFSIEPEDAIEFIESKIKWDQKLKLIY